MDATKLNLTIDELHAFRLMRKTIQRKPYIVPALIEGLSKEMAVETLLKLKTGLNELLAVNRAFAEACQKLAKQDNPENK